MIEENAIQSNGGITINVNVSVTKCHVCEKNIYIKNPSICSCKNRKYLASIMDDSAIKCDETMESRNHNEETKNIPKNFNGKKATCKRQNFYILLAFLLITTALLLAVRIYSYLIKYQAKQKHLLPFQVTNNELRESLC